MSDWKNAPELRGLAVLAVGGTAAGALLARNARPLEDHLGDVVSVALGLLQLIVAVAALSIGLVSDEKLPRPERLEYLARVRRAAMVSATLLFVGVALRMLVSGVTAPGYWIRAICLAPSCGLAVAAFAAAVGVTLITVRALAPKASSHDAS